MHKKSSLYTLFVLALTQGLGFTAMLHAQNTDYSMALCDTGLHDALIYKRFIDIASQAGFNVTYYSLADLIDIDKKDFLQKEYSCLALLIEDPFLAQQSASPISKKIIDLVRSHAEKNDAATYYMIPLQHQFTLKKSQKSPLLAYNILLEPFGLFFNAMGSLESKALHKTHGIDFSGVGNKPTSAIRFKNPFAWLGNYATSLRASTNQNRLDPFHIKGDTAGSIVPTFGSNHILFWGHAKIASYSSITEDFRFFPLETEKQERLEEDIFTGLCLLHQALTKVKNKTSKIENKNRKLNFTKLNHIKKINKKASSKKVLAWMELDVFGDKKLIIPQSRIINAIISSNPDGLWLSISPNQYFSIRAKFADRLGLLEESIKAFSKQLLLTYQQKKKKIPQIFISFEIANNFVDKNLHPKESMIDVYGIEYPDVPAPLDRSWWQEEVIDSASKFVSFWNKHVKNIPISGFFLDLEMYLRNETGHGEFVGSALGSSRDLSFIKKEGSSIQELAQDLIEQKKMHHFSDHLTKQAEDFGHWLKRSLQEIIPQAVIACYAAHLSMDWFYQGLYRALSTKQEPLILCSFNSHFNDFKSAAEKQGLYFDYYAALMLSHLKTEKDFPIYSELLRNNDGVWLNKLSRLSFPYQPQEWHIAEQTPLSFEERKKLLDFIAKNR